MVTQISFLVTIIPFFLHPLKTVYVLQARKVFQGIDNIIIKSLQSVQKIIINDKHCFEMYGYDVLLDANLKP